MTAFCIISLIFSVLSTIFLFVTIGLYLGDSVPAVNNYSTKTKYIPMLAVALMCFTFYGMAAASYDKEVAALERKQKFELQKIYAEKGIPLPPSVQ